MFLLEFIVFVVLILWVFRLSARVGELEKKVNGGAMPAPAQRANVATSTNESSAPVAAVPPAPAFMSTPPVMPAGVPQGPTLGEQFSAWLKEDWLLKLGAFIVLLGFAWLTTYAFMNNWIGPTGRIVLGIVAGALLMGFGYHRMKRFINQGSIFLVLGSATVILTIFAAREYYDMFTPTMALIIMFLASSFVALASVRYRVQSLALISLILAGLTPLMIGSPNADPMGLFIYLFVVTIGTVWIVALTGWRVLIFAALMLVSLYSVSYWIGMNRSAGSVLLLAYAFAALFFVVGTLGVLKSQGKDRMADLLVAGGNGVFLLLWILNQVSVEWQSLVMAAWLLVFAVGGFIVFRITKQSAPFLLYAAVSVMFLAAATAVELNGAALVIAYAFEAAAIPLILCALIKDIALAEVTGWLLAVPAALSIPHIIGKFWGGDSFFQNDFWVLLCMAAALLIVGIFFLYKKEQSPKPLRFYPIFIIAGLVYIYIIIWRAAHAMTDGADGGTTFALLIYTIIGLASYFRGKANGVRAVYLHGSVLLGFVVGRLLLIDVWDMEMGGRIVTFFLVGALLMTTAFVGRKKKALKEPGMPAN